MELQAGSQRALATWLGASWESSHELDMHRWYDFINEFSREHGYHLDERALEDRIEGALNRHLSDEMLDTIRARIGLACKILDFLQHTGR